MDKLGEGAVSIVNSDVPMLISFHDGEKEHIFYVDGGHDMATLARWPHGLYPDLVNPLRADNSFLLIMALRDIRVGDIGMEMMAKKFLDKGNLAVIPIGDVPHICLAFRITLSSLPRAGKRPLMISIYNLAILNLQPFGL